jgi:hypothetical protein
MASRQRAKIQSALDEALLAGSIAGKQALDAGSGAGAAIAAAKSAANAFFTGNTPGFSSELAVNYTMSGLTLTGSGTATVAVPTNFSKLLGLSSLNLSVASNSSSTTHPYLNV